MDKRKKLKNFMVSIVMIGTIFSFLTVFGFMLVKKTYAAETAVTTQTTETAVQADKKLPPSPGWYALAAALAVGLGSIAGGIAVASVGSAALAAISERPEIMGQSLLFVGLAEGIAIYGLIIAIFILMKI